MDDEELVEPEAPEPPDALDEPEEAGEDVLDSDFFSEDDAPEPAESPAAVFGAGVLLLDEPRLSLR